MSGFNVGNRRVGGGAPTLIVGEVAQAHEGSLTIAHAYIDAIADAGADAVKMQCHLAEAESTRDEPWRVAPRWPQDASRYDYWRRMQFPFDQWAGLASHAWQRGLAFIVSPFSVEAVKMMEPLVDAWKVASGEVTHEELLRAIAATGKPVLLSSGMSTTLEINNAVVFLGWPDEMRLLQCTSAYPCPPEKIGLAHAAYWRGLSDHSGTIYAGLAAVTLGCDVLEVHVAFSRAMQGFDTASSITLPELKQLVEGVRWIEKAKASPVEKDAMAKELEPMRAIFAEKHARRAACQS